ncbi:MAG: class I SAM-dependent methyltransferase [Bacteroidetes bacterium]|nr:class I SAM-dependent methyltransferase [Bacteroidota bacterium]
MFFPHLMNIKNDELVLEIGPGAYPFWRSDCLVDIYDENSQVDLTQFGGAELRTKGKPLFLIENNTLPFKDNSFDYIICSHVFEHVPINDLKFLASEIMRVGKKAYIEFPKPLYDYLYNFKVHLNLMDIVNGEILCLDKSQTDLSAVKRFQELSYGLRKKNLFSIDEHFAPVVAIGKEFVGDIPLKILESEDEFFELVINNKYYVSEPSFTWKVFNKMRPARIVKNLIGEIKRDRLYSCLTKNNEN